MRAIGYTKSLPIDDPQSLIDLDLPKPEATGYSRWHAWVNSCDGGPKLSMPLGRFKARANDRVGNTGVLPIYAT